MRGGIIYRATNKKTGKAYVGQTVKKLSTRIAAHYNYANVVIQSSQFKHNNHFAAALRKYSKCDWEWEELAINVPEINLTLMEIWYIAKYETFGCGYNSTEGGQIGTMTEAGRIRMSKARMGREVAQITRQRLSAAMMGNKNSLGKKRSPDVIRKIAEKNAGKKRTIAVRMEMSRSRKGRRLTASQKAAIRETLIGRPVSPETRRRIGDGNAKNTYIVTRPDGKDDTVTNVTEYCRLNNLTVSAMVAVSKGRRKHHKGYTCSRAASRLNDASTRETNC
jgi:hypothetical protein